MVHLHMLHIPMGRRPRNLTQLTFLGRGGGAQDRLSVTGLFMTRRMAYPQSPTAFQTEIRALTCACLHALNNGFAHTPD